MSATYSTKEIATHTTAASAWVIVEGGVYDVTEFLEEHPGGKKILLNTCGTDATEKFWKFHSKKILTKTAAKMLIGAVEGTAKL